MRKSTVLSLTLQFVFPAYVYGSCFLIKNLKTAFLEGGDAICNLLVHVVMHKL